MRQHGVKEKPAKTAARRAMTWRAIKCEGDHGRAGASQFLQKSNLELKEGKGRKEEKGRKERKEKKN